MCVYVCVIRVGTYSSHLAEVDEVILDVSGQGLDHTREPIQHDTQVGDGGRVCPGEGEDGRVGGYKWKR